MSGACEFEEMEQNSNHKLAMSSPILADASFVGTNGLRPCPLVRDATYDANTMVHIWIPATVPYPDSNLDASVLNIIQQTGMVIDKDNILIYPHQGLSMNPGEYGILIAFHDANVLPYCCLQGNVCQSPAPAPTNDCISVGNCPCDNLKESGILGAVERGSAYNGVVFTSIQKTPAFPSIFALIDNGFREILNKGYCPANGQQQFLLAQTLPNGTGGLSPLDWYCCTNAVTGLPFYPPLFVDNGTVIAAGAAECAIASGSRIPLFDPTFRSDDARIVVYKSESDSNPEIVQYLRNLGANVSKTATDLGGTTSSGEQKTVLISSKNIPAGNAFACLVNPAVNQSALPYGGNQVLWRGGYLFSTCTKDSLKQGDSPVLVVLEKLTNRYLNRADKTQAANLFDPTNPGSWYDGNANFQDAKHVIENQICNLDCTMGNWVSALQTEIGCSSNGCKVVTNSEMGIGLFALPFLLLFAVKKWIKIAI